MTWIRDKWCDQLEFSSRLLVAALQTPNYLLYLASTYVRHTIGEGLQQVMDWVDITHSSPQPFVVGGDFHSSNELWGPIQGANRTIRHAAIQLGRKVEKILFDHNLHLLNDSNSPPVIISRASGTGTSWIDLRFTFANIQSSDWMVLPYNKGLSDHLYSVGIYFHPPLQEHSSMGMELEKG